jgi:hypothetical protein
MRCRRKDPKYDTLMARRSPEPTYVIYEHYASRRWMFVLGLTVKVCGPRRSLPFGWRVDLVGAEGSVRQKR